MRALLYIVAIWLWSTNSYSAEKSLVVYSSRNEQLIKPLFDAYTKESGVNIRFVTDKEAALIQRLKMEGARSPADLLLTVDAGNLWYAAEQGLFQKTESKELNKAIPEHLRDPQGYWFALSIRARTIVYNPEKVKASDLGSYEDLAEARWKGRLCLRTSQKVYNQSLVAMMIAEHGEVKVESWVRAWVKNLARPVLTSDNDVMEAIAKGTCDVGIVNTYYYGRLIQDKPQLKLKLHWPPRRKGGGGGVHVNISGGGVLKHAPSSDAAQEFLEWLAQGDAQKLFAEVNLEYPAHPGVEVSPQVKAWGTFEQSTLNLSKAGELQSAAVRLMERAGYR